MNTKRFNQLLESKSGDVRPLLEYDLTDENTIDLVYKCAKVQKGMINQVHDDISPFLNQVLLACQHFTSNNLNWYEESFVPALENVTKNKADFDKTQNILRCLLPKKGIQIEENNPILTICRKMFTTKFFGKRVPDPGEGTNINRAQIALAKLGIVSPIVKS